jgi:hypothetical protein
MLSGGVAAGGCVWACDWGFCSCFGSCLGSNFCSFFCSCFCVGGAGGIPTAGAGAGADDVEDNLCSIESSSPIASVLELSIRNAANKSARATCKLALSPNRSRASARFTKALTLFASTARMRSAATIASCQRSLSRHTVTWSVYTDTKLFTLMVSLFVGELTELTRARLPSYAAGVAPLFNNARMACRCCSILHSSHTPLPLSSSAEEASP